MQNIRSTSVATGAQTLEAGGGSLAVAGAAGAANGAGPSATFSGPGPIDVDPATGFFYVFDQTLFNLRRIAPGAPNMVTTVSGRGALMVIDGLGTRAGHGTTQGIACAPAGGWCALADVTHGGVRTVATASGLVASITPANSIIGARAIAVLPSGAMYVCNVSAMWAVTQDGAVSYVSGALPWTAGGFVDGAPSAARFGATFSGTMRADGGGTLYFADSSNRVVRSMNASGFVSTVLGSGVNNRLDDFGAMAQFGTVYSAVFARDAAGSNTLFLADFTSL
jgi:DNA-binding beta-propeller fold protein YncE